MALIGTGGFVVSSEMRELLDKPGILSMFEEQKLRVLYQRSKEIIIKPDSRTIHADVLDLHAQIQCSSLLRSSTRLRMPVTGETWKKS